MTGTCGHQLLKTTALDFIHTSCICIVCIFGSHLINIKSLLSSYSMSLFECLPSKSSCLRKLKISWMYWILFTAELSVNIYLQSLDLLFWEDDWAEHLKKICYLVLHSQYILQNSVLEWSMQLNTTRSGGVRSVINIKDLSALGADCC